MTITVRPVSAADHLAFIEKQGAASFLQTPAWAKVKPEWGSELLGFHSGDARADGPLVGVGLVLVLLIYRNRRSIALDELSEMKG